jgi:MFS family permease
MPPTLEPAAGAGDDCAAAPVRRRGGLAPLLAIWGAWLLVMTGSNLPAPLYATYADRYGFSSLVITAIFTTYALVLVPSLLVFGRLSDAVGRRPVMVAGLICACAGLIVFAAARGTAWLFAARALQGLAVGLYSGPATAALVEFDAESSAARPALLAGLAQAGGTGAGSALTGVLAEWAPAPRQLSYLVVLAFTLVAIALVFAVPEPSERSREGWRIQRPRVPHAIRLDFARVSVTAAAVWASVALFISIVPKYSGHLLHTGNLALLGAIGGTALGASCAGQIVGTRLGLSRSSAQALGLGLLALGLVALVVAAPAGSLALLLAGAVATGLGHGLGFLNAQDELNAIAPARHRGEVTSAFIACIYAFVGTAVLAIGLLDRRVSLSVAVGAVALVVAAVALATLAWQSRVAAASAD